MFSFFVFSDFGPFSFFGLPFLVRGFVWFVFSFFVFGFFNFVPGEKTHTLNLLVFFEEYWESFLDKKQRGSTRITEYGYNQTRERNMSAHSLKNTMVDLTGVYGRCHNLFCY